MSLRLRLSLLYSAILALTMLAFGAVLYSLQSQYTLSWLKQDLVVSSSTLSQSVLRIYLDSQPSGTSSQSSPPTQPSGTVTPSSSPAQAITSDQALQQSSESEIVRVLDPGGTLIASPFGSGVETLPLSAAGLQVLRSQQAWWEIAQVAGARLLIYSVPVVYKQQTIYILQIARPLAERDQSLRTLGITLIIAAVLVTLAAFGIGWLLVGFTLRPIRRITQTAQAIGAERDFTRRVDYNDPQDEVGQLALTFNAMLAQLKEAYQKVGHSLEMQRSFVADVSHELRTPLTTLRGNLGLLNRQPPIPAAEQADVLADMVDESDRLIRLVNDLLVLARADAGRSLAKQAVILQPLVAEICRQASQLAPQRSITSAVPEDIAALGDRDAIKQVLLILLDNAVKHSQGAITVSAEVRGTQVIVCVQDEGAGIAPDKLVHVFDRFYRGEDQPLTPGFGLGLPIAKALVEAQGGSIAMQSELGKGSTVIVMLQKGE